ncbi:MAG: hypothetical protein O7C59_02470 [Rickettsia endosymbiont of Ixodes persulcatus]|nr:hypothetical protein [Rickettsia endosymbiont of Ixodes persulcatus]
MFIFVKANRMVWNPQYKHPVYTDEKLNHLGNRFSKKHSPFKYNPEEVISPFDMGENVSCLGNRFSKEPRLFNYNPEKEEVSAFVAKVLAKLFPPEKTKEFEELSNKIEGLKAERRQVQDEVKKNEYGEHIKDFQNELTVKKQVREKVKFSFEGFDILKNAIPAELFAYTKDVSENDILVILRKGYLTNQVNALFNLSQSDMDELSKKGQNRKGKEDIIYVNVIELMSKILELVDVRRTEAVDYLSSKKKILKDIKKMGSEGKKMYKLLCHLT